MELSAGNELPFTEEDKTYLPGQLYPSEGRTHSAPLEGLPARVHPPARAHPSGCGHSFTCGLAVDH